ncbi:MAG TPA: hypothetical protein VFQ61_09975 [Polyangiaceae bacterium]|nr:hypothetical protein [Polyangiaceae bacterium]
MRSDYRSPSLSSALTLLLAASVLLHCGVTEKSAPTPNPATQGGSGGRSSGTAEGGDDARAGEGGEAGVANGGASGVGGGASGSSGTLAPQGGTTLQTGDGGSAGAIRGEGGEGNGQGGSEAGAGGAAGESTAPISGGRSGGSGGQSNASGGGGQTSASGGRTNTGGGGTTAECSLNVHCSNASRPFCSPQGRCVQCLNEGQCPAPTAECLKRACSNYTCTEVPQTANTACGDRASTTCSAPDTCDGRGNCIANHAAPNTACDDGQYCNGADRCNSTGVCEHAGSPCTAPLVCYPATNSCRCVNAGRSVADYCYSDPSQIEGLDRPATDTATAACGACGGFNRVSSGNCVDFVCKG